MTMELLTLRDVISRLHGGEDIDTIFGGRSNPKAKLASTGGDIAVAPNFDNVFDFKISKPNVDRQNDTIKLDGWKTAEYANAPVVLWAHDHLTPAIGRASNTRIAGGALVQP